MTFASAAGTTLTKANIDINSTNPNFFTLSSFLSEVMDGFKSLEKSLMLICFMGDSAIVAETEISGCEMKRFCLKQ